MKYLSALALLAFGAHAQTSVYLRASAPQAQVVIGATNATPVVLQTYAPHGFSLSCNTTTNPCYCNPTAVLTGTGASPVNGVRECVPTDSTHLAVYDLSGNPIAGNGAWSGSGSIYPNVGPSAQFVGLLTKYTIPANAGPLGYFDGTNGDLMRRWSLSTFNGMASTNGVSVSGCPGTCIISVNLTYNPTTFGSFPWSAPGVHFSVNGTGTALDTCGDGTAAAGPQSPYTMASVSPSGGVSAPFTCAGLANTDYTNINLHCGPAATPNDTIGGTQTCTRVSQMATTANALWNYLLTRMVNDHTSASPDYLSVYDGGSMIPGNGIQAYYGEAALRFLVDPTNHLWLDEIIYSLNHDFYTSGTGYPFNAGAFVSQSNSELNYTTDMEGLTLSYSVAAHAPEGRYWTASEQATFLNRMFNDIDDPSAIASTTNQNAANQSTHNWVLSSGLLSAGTNDATHAQLPSSDPHFSTTNYYVNTVIEIQIGNSNDYASNGFALVTAQSNTGALTFSGGIHNVGGGLGFAPGLQNIVAATYASGLICSGTTNQTVVLNVGSQGGILVFQLTGANALAGGTAVSQITSVGTYISGAPTSATVDSNYGSAVCTGTATISTTLGTAYTIFDTVTTNNTGSGSATITFAKTAALSGSINAGDGIFGMNGWPSNFFPSGLALVTAVGTNTVTATNPGSSPYTSATPQVAWRIPQWVPGDSGRLAATKAQGSTSIGVQPAVYGPGGNSLTLMAAGYPHDDIVNGGGSNPNSWPIFELATAADDARAVRDLGRSHGAMFDYGIRPLIDFSTGRLRDGPGYSTDEDAQVADLFLWGTHQSIPSYPSLNVTGPWAQNQALWQMFDTLPDLTGGAAWIGGWGGHGYGLYERDGLTGQGLSFSPSIGFAPSSANAGYFRGWMDGLNGPGSYFGSVSDDRLALSVIYNDPRIPSNSGYTSLPTQFAFNKSNSADVATLTGWPSLYRGDAVISRTSWTSQSATLVLFDAATFTSTGVYDSPRGSQLSIWANGCLLCADSNPGNGLWAQDTSVLSDAIQFGSGGNYPSGFMAGTGPGNIGQTNIYLWASDTAGSMGSQWGDASSNYMATCNSVAANYNQTNLNIALDHANVCSVHQKKSGHDQFVWQFHDAVLAGGSPTGSLPMAWHIHYPQNGASQSAEGGYTTGATTYLGSNVIKELEDGSGTPARAHGLLTYVTSPNTIFVNDDCASVGTTHQCNDVTYSGGQGFSHRFTVAGGASVGANVSKLQTVACHKVMSTLTDTTFTQFNLNPDANWTGAGCTGANSTGIALFALGGIKPAPTSFSASFSGAADWTIVGINPGVYAVKVGSTVVTGSPFAVSTGSNTLAFSTSGGGTVSITQTSAPVISGSGKISGSGNIGH